MDDESLVVTFAEIEFMLKARPPENARVREQLSLREDGEPENAAAAGLASLLARGLCTRGDDQVTPSEELTVIIAALSSATRATRALGWVGEHMVLVHFFTGPVVGVAFYPMEFGQFRVQPLDPDRTLSDQLAAFVDCCLTGQDESAVLIQSALGAERITAALATDEAGAWFVSDSVASPDRSVPSSRDAAVARITQLLDSGQTAAVSP